jgi:hypothetical protein
METSSIRKLILTVSACACAAIGFVAMQAFAAGSPSANDVQAAYLFNFVRFVEWPESSFKDESAPVKICVLGDSSFTAVAHDSINGRSVGNREVVVESKDSVLGSRGCHILYVDSSRRGDESEVLATFAKHSVLTVSETDDFAKRGGVANFVTIDDKIRFVINQKAAEAAGLKISSRLLRIAQVVE